MEQLVQFDPGLIIWTWLTFFIVLAILARKAWGPMITALEKRENRIRDSLSEADRVRRESEELTAKMEDELKKSRLAAKQIMARAREAGERVRLELEEAARGKADEFMARAKDQLEAERERTLREIRSNVVDLSISMAGKVIERNLSTEDNRRLVEESLRQLGRA